MSIDVTVWSITSISDNETYDDFKSLNIEPISLCFHNQISFQEVLISATSCLQLIRGQSWHQNQNSWARACIWQRIVVILLIKSFKQIFIIRLTIVINGWFSVLFSTCCPRDMVEIYRYLKLAWIHPCTRYEVNRNM